MDKQHSVGTLLITGFVLILIGSMVFPPGLFQEPDLSQRLVIIDEYRWMWTAANITWLIAGFLTGWGMYQLGQYLKMGEQGGLANIAGWLMLVGSLSFMVQIFMRTLTPEDYFEILTVWAMGFFWLAIPALILFGYVFLKTDYPNWLGLTSMIVMAALGILAILYQRDFFYNVPPQIFFLITLMVGFTARSKAKKAME